MKKSNVKCSFDRAGFPKLPKRRSPFCQRCQFGSVDRRKKEEVWIRRRDWYWTSHFQEILSWAWLAFKRGNFLGKCKTNFQKHNFSLGGTTELNNGVKINSSFNYVDSDLRRPPAAVGAGSNPAGASLFANLIYPPRSIDLNNLPYESPIDGSMVYYRRGAAIQNPWWTINNSYEGNHSMPQIVR